MKILAAEHKLRVAILGHISLIGLVTPETKMLEKEEGTLTMKLMCSMHSTTESQDENSSMGQFRFVPEPVPMELMGPGVESVYWWNSYVNKTGVVCYSEIDLDSVSEEVGIVKDFSDFWGIEFE